MVPVVATGFYSSQHPPPVVAGHLHSKDLVIDPELVKCLQQLFPGRKVGFRSIEQGYAVHFIVHDSKHHSMIIIPTSGGKTMLYVIPALRASSYGVYIAIIPNRSLLDILKRKVEAFGIRVEEWRGGDPSPGNRCPLVLISADAIAHATFPQFLATLKSSSKLLGIFIDEAHKLVSEVHYRNRLVSMHRIVGAGVPIHCLTATLCPGQEFKIANALRLKMEDFQIIRAKTDRPNLSYRVIKVKPTSSVHELEAVVQRVVSEFGKADKELKDSECGLIIVRSKDQVKMLVDRLGCSSFHGDMDPEVRIKEYTDWQFGKLEGRMGSGWMVSTTLIDTGMDVAKLRFTLYCENPYHFESYLQGAGRTAREGQDGEVTVIYSRFSAGKSNIGLDREFVGIKALEEYLDNTTECRRYQITKYTDGVGIACSAIENVNLCDTCNHGFFPSEVSIEIDPHVNTVPEALRVFRFETAHLESIVQSLQSLKYTLIPSKVCPFEFIITGEKVNDHTWKTCACMKTYPTSLASTRLTEGMEMFMSKIIWLANHTCYICWFPHGGKESRLHSDKDWLHRDPGAKEAGNNCRIFIAACLHSIFHNTGLRTKLESTFGLPKIPDDYEAFMSYIIQIQSPGLPMALVMIARCMQSNN
jgi:superfamily II DNA helicase RecQ